MQNAASYVMSAAAGMEQAVRRMQPVLTLPGRQPLPSTPQDIFRYVEELLTSEEQHLCDMATD